MSTYSIIASYVSFNGLMALSGYLIWKIGKLETRNMELEEENRMLGGNKTR